MLYDDTGAVNARHADGGAGDMQQTNCKGEDAHFGGGATAVCNLDAQHSTGAQDTHGTGWAAERCPAGARELGPALHG